MRLFDPVEPLADWLANKNSILEMYGWTIRRAVDCGNTHRARSDLRNSLSALRFPATAVNIDDLALATQSGGLRIGRNLLDTVIVQPPVFLPLRMRVQAVVEHNVQSHCLKLRGSHGAGLVCDGEEKRISNDAEIHLDGLGRLPPQPVAFERF